MHLANEILIMILRLGGDVEWQHCILQCNPVSLSIPSASLIFPLIPVTMMLPVDVALSCQGSSCAVLEPRSAEACTELWGGAVGGLWLVECWGHCAGPGHAVERSTRACTGACPHALWHLAQVNDLARARGTAGGCVCAPASHQQQSGWERAGCRGDTGGWWLLWCESMEACLFPPLVPRARIIALLAISWVLCTNMMRGFYLQVWLWQLTEVESGEIAPVTFFFPLPVAWSVARLISFRPTPRHKTLPKSNISL